MSIPETTSTGGLESYLGGKCLFHTRGEAWRDLKARIVVQPPEGDTSTFQQSVNHSSHGPFQVRWIFKSENTTGLGSLIESGKVRSFSPRVALLMMSAGKQ